MDLPTARPVRRAGSGEPVTGSARDLDIRPTRCLALKSPDQVRVAGIDPDLVGTVRRADGRLQLTLDGHPLYRFAKDRRPGDLKGQCKDGVFFAATPEGGKTTMSAA